MELRNSQPAHRSVPPLGPGPWRLAPARRRARLFPGLPARLAVAARRWLAAAAVLLLLAGVALAQQPNAGEVEVGTEVLSQSGNAVASTPGVGPTQVGWLANFQQSFGSDGLLTLSFDSATDGSTWQNGNNLAAWRNLPFAGGRWFLRAGTLNFATDRMPLHFGSLYSPNVYLSGGAAEYRLSGLSVTAFAGRELIQEGPYLPFFTSSPSELSGVQLLFSNRGPLTLEARYFHTRSVGAPGLLAPVLGQPPASADNVYLDGDYRLGKHDDWLGELSLSRARQTAAPAAASQTFLSYFFGPMISRPSFDIQAYVLREGEDYLPLSNVISGDRTGAYASIDLHPSTRWSLSTSLADYHAGGLGTSPFADSDAFTTGGAFSFNPGNGYSLVASATRGQITPVSGAQGPSLGLTTAQLQAGRSYGANRTYLRYQDWVSTSTVAGDNSTVHSEEVEQDRMFGGDSISAIVGLQQNAGGATTLNGQLGGNLQFGQWFTLSGSAQLGKDLRDQTALSLETYRTIMLLATVHLPWQFALSGEWIHNSSVSQLNPARVLVGLGAGPVPLLPALSQQTVFFRLTKTIHWGHGVPMLAGLPENDADSLVPTYTSVTGVVFNDRAGTGRWAAGDSGVPGVEVTLSGRTAITNAKGRYEFPAVRAGQYLLGLDMNHLPAAYSAPDARPRLIQVGAEAPRVNIPLQVVGAVSGAVFANGKPLAGLELRLRRAGKPAGGALYAFTGKDGKFAFQDVLPGEYHAVVALDSAPPGARLAAPVPPVLVTSGGAVHGLTLRLTVPVHYQAVQTTVEAAETIGGVPPPPRKAAAAPKPAAAKKTTPAKAQPQSRLGSRPESIAASFRRHVADIYFAFNRSNLDAVARATLRRDAAWLRAHPTVPVLVAGYCDTRGSARGNRIVGQRRANAARQLLVRLGVAARRIRAVGHGKTRQFCAANTPFCWRSNRRDHFVIAAGKP